MNDECEEFSTEINYYFASQRDNVVNTLTLELRRMAVCHKTGQSFRDLIFARTQFRQNV